ncbi:MAG: hypothetical protein ISR65_02830 [Bacteriovoracaceae bacterium]|nr:hypothetical protein [Bacteriovoracaceae bacterium]
MYDPKPSNEIPKNQNTKKSVPKKIKSVKIDFNLDIESDRKTYQLLEELELKTNKNSKETKIKKADLFKASVKKLNDSDLLELKVSTLSKKDKLSIWTDNYNKDKGETLSTEDFAVDVLRTLSPKEAKKYLEITL